MSAFVTFAKARWLPLSLLGGVIVVVPVAIYLSSEWRASIVERVSKAALEDAGEMTKGKTNYKISPLIPGGEVVEHTAYPNEVITNFFKAERDKQTAQAGELYKKVLEFNKANHVNPDGSIKVLVKGVFPDPTDQENDIKRDELARAFQSAPAKLLAKAKAGTVLDPVALAKDAQDLYNQLGKAMLPPGMNDLTKLTQSQRDEIKKKLTEFRFARVVQHAASMDFYADTSAFRLPGIAEGTMPTMTQCYDWQQQHWVMEDVIEAIRNVNRPPGPGNVARAIVKRLEYLEVDSKYAGPPQVDPNAGALARSGTEVAPPGDVMPVNYAVSVTGRMSGPGTNNNLYDIRTGRVVVIVSAKNATQFINALAKTNYISVLDLDVEALDSTEELRKGFYYGDEAVLKMSLVIETIWLRDWTMSVMPKDIRAELGVPDPVAPTPPTGTTPPPPAG